jgi:cytosine/adenosine deaminase-related metal-dependent hydrolase
MSLVVAGRIVPLTRQASVAPSETASFRGRVWIGDDGRIAAVTKSSRKGPPGFDAAPVVDVGNELVVPGFIDLHSHLAYATLPLWVEAGRATPFAHHDIWPTRPGYAREVTWPAYAFVVAAPAELLAYAEIRALVGGTTSIQGSPPSNRPLDGWLVRNVEDERLGGALASTRVLASTLTLKPQQLGTRAGQMRQGDTFIYHCAEGRRDSIVAREFEAVRVAGGLQRNLVAIHTNALPTDGYAPWTEPGAIVWSPFSNLWLYGETTDVPAARERGITVCVGSDWGPSGTRNVLGELKVAALVSESRRWGLTDFELVQMITTNPGDVLASAWDVPVGRLEPGALGDVVVIRAAARADPFSTIVRATEQDVHLVVVGGRPLVGTPAHMRRAGATHTSALRVGGVARVLSLTRFDAPDEPWSFATILRRMKQVRADPKKEIETARVRAYASATRGEPAGLRLALDMPTGRVPIGGLPKDLGSIVVPPIQPLAHDDAFFVQVAGRGFHGGLLDGLAAFYA